MLGTTQGYPGCPDVYQAPPSTEVVAGTAQQRLGDRLRPSEEAEENRGTPSLPALLIGHIRLSSKCGGAGRGGCIPNAGLEC